jgi:membrane associated rhomboid family serine protease
MGLRSAVRCFQCTAAAWGQGPRAWGQQHPFNSQQHAAQKYLDLLLARLCPKTLSSAGVGGAPLAAAAGMGRAAFATFTPSRLYPKAFKYTTEDAAFWGIIGANVLAALACKAEAPGAREFVMRHMRTSVEALVDGRYHTLVTCVVSHYSLIHMAINLAMLAVFRRTQPLAAGKVRLGWAPGRRASGTTAAARDQGSGGGRVIAGAWAPFGNLRCLPGSGGVWPQRPAALSRSCTHSGPQQRAPTSLPVPRAPLRAACAPQLLELYALGGVAGAAGHAAYCWWDAGGLRFGTQYALNTPSFFGCSGGVAAVTAYKAVLEPAALRMVGGIIPLPILFALPLYCAMEVKEAVSGVRARRRGWGPAGVQWRSRRERGLGVLQEGAGVHPGFQPGRVFTRLCKGIGPPVLASSPPIVSPHALMPITTPLRSTAMGTPQS